MSGSSPPGHSAHRTSGSLDGATPSRPSLNPFARYHATLLTRLSPEECADRLGPHALTFRQREAWWFPDPSRWPVLGHVDAKGFSLRRVIQGRNTFLTMARGRFARTPHGTRIEVTLGATPVGLVAWTTWMGFVLLDGFWGDIRWIIVQHGQGAAPVPFFNLFFLAFGYCIYWVCRQSSLEDDAFLLRLLVTTLDARLAKRPNVRSKRIG